MTIAARMAPSINRRRTRCRTWDAAVTSWRSGRRSCSIQLPYSETKVCSRRGSLWSTRLAAGAAARISHGVSSVVIADTVTATG